MLRVYPSAASFLVTEQCNLRCTYCFEKHNSKVMSEEVAKKGLELLAQGAIQSGHREFSAMLFGGEPLLVPDIVELILEYGCELAKKHNLRFTASIVTNATRMDDNIYRILSTYRDKVDLGVQLSVDGIKEVQDMYRVTAGGKGSFDMVAKNVPVFKSIFHNKKEFLTIHGCINKQSLPYLFENYKFFREEWDFARIWFLPVMEEEWDNDDVLLYYNENKKIYDYIMERVKKDNSLHEVLNYAPMDKCVQPTRSMRAAPCGAGKNFVTITAEGEIYPCHQIYFNDPDKDTFIGDVWNGVDPMNQRIWAEYGGEDLSCDDYCDHGDCYKCIAVNWIANGSIFSQVKGQYCKLSRIDRYFQSQLKEELTKMGLITRDKCNPEKCNCGDGHSSHECDVVNFNGKTYDLEIFDQKKAYLDARGEPQEDLGCGIVKHNGKVYDTNISEQRKEYKEAISTHGVYGKKTDNYIVVGSWERDGEEYEARQGLDGSVNIVKVEKEQPHQEEDEVGVILDALKMILMRLDEVERLIKTKVGD